MEEIISSQKHSVQEKAKAKKRLFVSSFCLLPFALCLLLFGRSFLPITPTALQTSKASASEAEIDAALQRTATAALGEREGTIIILDPQTGRVRAVVNPQIGFE